MIVASHPRLQSLSIKDLIALLFIVSIGISELRWKQPDVSDLHALRNELTRREWEVGR